ncbi:MAG: aminotransferase class V-fold PLP-dependent enzyme [Gemmatimonadota bacterium]
MAEIVYMDHAATSAVRPPVVSRAVAEYIDTIGATPGRGGHRLAHEAGRVALRCRQRIAQLMDVPGDASRVTFAPNATYALNAALWGVLRRGDRVIVSDIDHNAVLRPCAALARERDVAVTQVPCTPEGALDERTLEQSLGGARLLVLNAASNVLGNVLDVRSLAALARAAGVLTLVDVAQLAGHVPFSVTDWGADMVAFTGHKGLLGPQGIGGLWVRQGVEVEPLVTGGTGGDSLQRDMPAAWPDHLEAGSLNGPGIAGLYAGAGFVLDEGVAAMHARLAPLKQQLRDALVATPRVRVVSPAAPDGVAIVTVTTDGVDVAAVAARLDREHGVLTRPGLHCAPEAHRLLGTATTGALRFSLGWSSTAADVERAAAAIRAVLA